MINCTFTRHIVFILVLIVAGFSITWANPRESQREAHWFALRLGEHLTHMAALQRAGHSHTQYSYPVGYTVGLVASTPLVGRVSLRVEGALELHESQLTTMSVRESTIHQTVQTTALRFPFVLQYHLPWGVYGLAGGIMGTVLETNYTYKDNFLGSGTLEITHNLPPVDWSLTLGVGQDLREWEAPIFWDLRAILGLTTFQQFGTDSHYIGSWHYNILQGSIGIYL